MVLSRSATDFEKQIFLLSTDSRIFQDPRPFLLDHYFVLSRPVSVPTNDVTTSRQSHSIHVAEFINRGKLPEVAHQPSFFGDLQPTLQKLIGRLEAAAVGRSISAIGLRIQNPRNGRGNGPNSPPGKTVCTSIQIGSAQDYLLASTCNEVLVPESGTLMISGIHAEVPSSKTCWINLASRPTPSRWTPIRAQLNPTQNRMSDEFRKHYESMIGDLFYYIVTKGSQDGGPEEKKVREVVDVRFVHSHRRSTTGID